MMERHVVDGGYVTNYNDPVVGIKPINQKSIETAMSGKKFYIDPLLKKLAQKKTLPALFWPKISI